MPLGQTVRFVELDELTDNAEARDLLVIVDRSDTSISAEGSDKYVTAQRVLETTPLRPVDAPGVSRSLTQWIADFRNDISGLNNRTQDATTGRFGVTRYATNTQARSKTSTTRTLTPSNLSAMDASTSFAGLIALATAQQVEQGTAGDVAITPQTLFDNILGDAALGSDNWVFKLPTRNIAGGIKTELVVQFGQAEFDTMETQANPTSNFNHIHGTVDVDVTFPQAFPNRTLMVIPVGFEVTESQYIEGTNFFMRPRSFNNSSAVIRASRISGTSDGNQRAGVRYLAIGY